MAKIVRASDILKAHKKTVGRDPRLLIQRLNIVEERKREREGKQLQAGLATQKLVQQLEQAGLKHRIAKAGGFEGGLLKFLFSDPTVSQGRFEMGQRAIKEDPNLLDPSLAQKGFNLIKDLFKGKGSELQDIDIFNPDIE